MGLGAADLRREARPLAADAGQAQAGRVDQPDHAGHFATQAASSAGEQMREQAGKHRMRTQAIGVGQRGAARRFCPGVIQPPLVAGHAGLDFAQRNRARQLRKEERAELMPCRKPAHQGVGLVFVHKPFERAPGNQCKEIAKNAIVVAHGVGPFVSR
jgi:hypothetical protein